MRTLSIFFASLTSFFIISSFTLSVKEDTTIPEEFDGQNTTLLVEIFNNDCFKYYQYTGKDSVKFAQLIPRINEYDQKQMKELLEKKYPYRSELASKDAIKDDPKYADKDKYRFVLMGYLVPLENVSNGSFSGQCAINFKIYDRKLNKEYTSLNGGSILKLVFTKCLDRLVEYTKTKGGKN